MKSIQLFITLLIFTGCSSYINSLYSQMDRESNATKRVPRNYDKFDAYRKPRQGAGGATNLVSTNSQKTLGPTVKRQYAPEETARRRYTSDDIYDTGSDNSLWSGQGKDSFLFTQDSKKRQGDIILVNVMTRLKNDITAELKRIYPAPQPLVAKKDKDTNTKKKGKGAPEEEPKPDQNEKKPEENVGEQEGAVHDKISTVIVEEINKDHVLLSGRKNILFRSRKHLVEVQALVSRRNITTEDNINSDDIIETNITVLR